MTIFEWTLLFFLSLLWGGSFFLAEIALVSFDPLTLAFCRVALAAGMLALAVKASGSAMPRSLAAWRDFAVLGLFNNVAPYSLIYWGQTRMEGGLAAILTATAPFFTILLAHFFTRDEKMSLPKLGGVAAGIAGVGIIAGPGALADFGGEALPQLAIIGAALCYAIAGILGKSFTGEPLAVMAAGQLAASAVLLLPLALIFGHAFTQSAPGVAAWSAVFALAAFSTALSYIIYLRILRGAGAVNVLLVTLLTPVSAILLGGLFLDEKLLARHFAGFAVIAAGFAMMDGRIFRLRRGRAKPAAS